MRIKFVAHTQQLARTPRVTLAHLLFCLRLVGKIKCIWFRTTAKNQR